MPTALVTGGLGFIGHHLARRLIADGWHVKIIDRGTTATQNQRADALRGSGAEIVIADIAALSGSTLLHGVDVIFHLAAQPGAQSSWGPAFAAYAHDNIVATQHLMERAIEAGIPRVVYASSSSVYGNRVTYPTSETQPLEPINPYGITKLAGEHLIRAYSSHADMTTLGLRYFNVYGPEQRHEAAFFRIINAAISGSLFTIYGSGNQTRAFTYIDDVIQATILAGTVPIVDHVVLNVAGRESTSVLDAIEIVQNLSGLSVRTEHRDADVGDPRRSEADLSTARRVLTWMPNVSVVEGLRRQFDFQQDTKRTLSAEQRTS